VTDTRDERSPEQAVRGLTLPQAEEALRRWVHIASASSDLMCFVDRHRRYRAVNQAFLEAFDKQERDVVDRRLGEVAGEEVFGSLVEPLLERCLADEHVNAHQWWDFPGLGFRYVDIHLDPFRDADGRVSGAVVNVRDVTNSRLAQDALEESEQRFKDFAEIAADWFFELDPDLRFVYLSERFEEIVGLPREQALGRKRTELFPEEDYATANTANTRRHYRDLEQHRAFSDYEFVRVHPDGSRRVLRVSGKPVLDDHGRFQGYRGVARDVTEAHLLAARLSHQASHDALTGLVNRREFESRLHRVLETSRADGSEHGLCYLDLDEFKVINDTCGHVAGDQLLKQLSGVLQTRVRKRDTLARLGGDEFGILMEHCSVDQLKRVAAAVLETVREFRFVWHGRTFALGVSVGLVPINGQVHSVEDVLRAADGACYAAKEGGRNRIHVYKVRDEELVRRNGELDWVARIERALNDDRLLLCSQPIVPIDRPRESPRACELLIRLLDEEDSLVRAKAFVGAAERYNLSERLDRWVVSTAFDWLADAAARLHAWPSTCFINLSARSIADGDFVEFAAQKLRGLGLPAQSVCFEVTETAATANVASAARFISGLKSLGFGVALDDFGSGLSSFNYLKDLPVDFLKIDGAFVKDILDDPVDLAMVRSINDIGHVMGKKTIAESVETGAVLEKLRELGVDYAQGYAVGRPRWIQETTLRAPA